MEHDAHRTAGDVPGVRNACEEIVRSVSQLKPRPALIESLVHLTVQHIGERPFQPLSQI
jgi:hypothetical protein